MLKHRPSPDTETQDLARQRLAMAYEDQMIHPGKSGDDGDAALDAALAAADKDMLAAISNGHDLDAGLARVLQDLDRSPTARPGIQERAPAYPGKDQEPGAADPGAPAPSRTRPPLPAGQAAVIIVIRARARHHARDLATDHDRALALDRALDRARALATDLASDLADALDRARALATDLASDLADARDLARALDHARALADDLALALDRARHRADELVGLLRGAEVDASGADLSALDLAEMSVLEGVVWTEETTWPIGVREQVQLRSREIWPGVYQVCGGSERDPSGLVTT